MTTTPISCQAAREQQLCVSANYLGTAGAAEIETLPLYIFIKILSSICALNWERVKAEMQIMQLCIDFFFIFFPPRFQLIENISDSKGAAGSLLGNSSRGKTGQHHKSSPWKMEFREAEEPAAELRIH